MLWSIQHPRASGICRPTRKYQKNSLLSVDYTPAKERMNFSLYRWITYSSANKLRKESYSTTTPTVGNNAVQELPLKNELQKVSTYFKRGYLLIKDSLERISYG